MKKEGGSQYPSANAIAAGIPKCPSKAHTTEGGGGLARRPNSKRKTEYGRIYPAGMVKKVVFLTEEADERKKIKLREKKSTRTILSEKGGGNFGRKNKNGRRWPECEFRRKRAEKRMSTPTLGFLLGKGS